MTGFKRRFLFVLALAIAAWALGTAAALAAPLEPTMSLSDLSAKLETSGGPVPGYLLTVVQGAAIETIPVDVLAVTSTGGGFGDPDALILFEAKGALIQKYGGIVAGMSGSPIYVPDVDDGGTPKLVGALSYGDYNTLNGTGLATPIEYMSAVEDTYSIASFAKPLLTSSGLVKDVVVTLDPKVAAGSDLPGTLVAKPLSTVVIGGVNPNSRGYRALVQALAARGQQVLPLVGPLGTGRQSWSTTFTAGSSVAALFARGDAWIGGIGTATYVNGSNVVAFGHPFAWDGSSGMYLANAWVDGIWPSSRQPYKIASAGMVRGTVTQDRGAGIVGVVGRMSGEATITSTATDLDSGRSVTTTSFMPDFAINDPQFFYGMYASFLASQASAKAVDALYQPGSAVTTTTVVANDGSQDYVLMVTNRYDSAMGISSRITQDVTSLVMQLNAINGAGIYPVRIKSVDLETQITRARNNAQVVDVTAPDGIKAGDNRLLVSLLRHGVLATETVEVHLNIPAGTSLNGRIVVGGGSSGFDEDAPEEAMIPGEMPGSSYADRRSLAQLADDVSGTPRNSDILALYVPMPESLPPIEDFASLAVTPGEISSVSPTGWYVFGSVSKSTTTLSVRTYPASVAYGGGVMVYGGVAGNDFFTGTLKVTGRYVGDGFDSFTRYVETDEEGLYDTYFTGLKKNVVFTVTYAGDDYSLGAVATRSVKVGARVTLASSSYRVRYGSYVTLSAALLPTTTTGSVTFDVYRGGRWVALSTRTIASGKATYRWRPARGTWRIRARYLGGSVNSSSVSAVKTVVAY